MITAAFANRLPHEQSNGLFLLLASFAVQVGMSHIVCIELSAKRLGIGACSRWTGDFPPNLDPTGCAGVRPHFTRT